MRKKLDTRFPAPRIKKIMQADEDVGKISMAVPLLVSKALELFLQDLCDRTYEITVKKGAKTVNSLHLKECVHGCNVFDFLRDTVSSVPDLGASEDTSTTKRRKISEGECGNDNDFARMYMQETGHSSNTGRGRGRGRGRGSRTLQKELFAQHEKFEDDPDISNQNIENQQEHVESLNTVAKTADGKDLRTADGKEIDKSVMNFDLNVDLNESVVSTQKLDEVPVGSPKKLSPHTKHEDVLGWSVDDMAMMAINPVQLANINKGMDEELEDYDAEG